MIFTFLPSLQWPVFSFKVRYIPTTYCLSAKPLSLLGFFKPGYEFFIKPCFYNTTLAKLTFSKRWPACLFNCLFMSFQSVLFSNVGIEVVWHEVKQPFQLDGAALCHQAPLPVSANYDKLMVEDVLGLQVAQHATWMDLQSEGCRIRQIFICPVELPLSYVHEKSK